VAKGQSMVKPFVGFSDEGQKILSTTFAVHLIAVVSWISYHLLTMS
jgi:hypothetical protein